MYKLTERLKAHYSAKLVQTEHKSKIYCDFVEALSNFEGFETDLLLFRWVVARVVFEDFFAQLGAVDVNVNLGGSYAFMT